MNAAESLARLDWEEVLARIARLASSDLGAEHVRSLRPAGSREQAEQRLATADQMVGLLVKLEWAPPAIPDSRTALRRLGIEGAVLDAQELLGIGVLLAASRLARSQLRRFPDELPALAGLGERLLKQVDLEAELGAALDEGGAIKDSASPALRKIRRDLRSARSSLVAKLEAYARKLPDRIQVPDASVTLRSGRYCIPIRREGRSEVGGIIHDESATHQTIFVEPPLAIEPMNRLAGLERDEAREIGRILKQLTDSVRPLSSELQSSLQALAEADSLFARARWALGHGGTRPAFLGDTRGSLTSGLAMRLVQAHHPLLVDGPDPSVPFDLDLFEGETVLLISGPNAGGKTVLLKTIGLTCLLAQSGVLPPVGPGTILPVVEDLYAVIGDEQSIVASLSTFSAQVGGVRDTLERADERSMVMLDEIGSSTDPAEGAALAAAVLTRLAEQAGLTVATTHLGALKALAAEDGRIVNASLQFDTRLLRPTFRLARDRPGRSYAIEIATRIGLPADVIADAQSRLGEEDRKLETLLAELEKREAELAVLTARAQLEERRLEEREQKLSGAEERAEKKERQLELEARARAEQYLKRARREVADEIRRLREQFRRSSAQSAGGESGGADREAAKVRSRVEQLYREAKAAGAPAVGEAAERRAAQGPVAGERVRSRSLGVEGLVSEVRGERVLLDAGGLRMEVPVSDVEPADGSGSGAAPEGRRAQAGRDALSGLPEVIARPEIDLRGLRTDEIDRVVLPAVDAAHVSDLPTLRIIHGKGTFALRERVADLLGRDRRIARLRPGGFEEGGSGVTVVEFRRGAD